jgi:hypothetical protein
MSVEDTVEELTTKILRCETLAGRAREQTGFAQEVVQHVVHDLWARRDSLVGELRKEVPRLWARHEEVRAQRDEVAQQVAALGFQIDELELRVAIGELEGSEQTAEARQALAEAQQRLTRLQEQAERLAERLARCEQLGPSAASGAHPDWEVGELEDAIPLPEPEEATEPVLVVYEGTPEEHRIALTREQLQLGRGKYNDLQLRGDAKISRSHLRVYRKDGGWWVTDCEDCANGTLVNGELIEGPRRLFGGEEIIVGETFLRFVYP